MEIEKESTGAVKFALGATLVEIQGKNIFDLLAPSDKDGNQPMCGMLGCVSLKSNAFPLKKHEN